MRLVSLLPGLECLRCQLLHIQKLWEESSLLPLCSIQQNTNYGSSWKRQIYSIAPFWGRKKYGEWQIYEDWSMVFLAVSSVRTFFWQCPTLNFGCEVGNIFRNPFPASVRWSNGLKYSSISKSVEQRKVTQLVYHLQHHFSVSFVSFTWSFWCKSFSDYLVAGLWEEMDLLACQILWHFHVYLCHSLICFQKGHHMTPLDMFLPRMCKKKIYDSIYKIYKKQFNYFIILYTKDINII